jgi:histidine triad (HIT) family protein
MPDCIFCAIAAGDIPSDIVLETDGVVAFRDVNPQAPVHVLVVPRRHVEHVHAMEPGDPLLVELVGALQQVAEREGIATSGYRVVANVGTDGGMSVPHLHFHVLGGRRLGWPPG